jgi:hypothetical protein
MECLEFFKIVDKEYREIFERKMLVRDVVSINM